MGSYNGAEICELVGLYLISQMQDLNINMGLYRRVGHIKANPKEKSKWRRKSCVKDLRENELSITVEANKTVVDFLDITLNPRRGDYKPYKKPKDTINYIHRERNHPPSLRHQSYPLLRRSPIFLRHGMLLL